MKPRYRYRWAAGAWKLMNEESVAVGWMYWLFPADFYLKR